MAIASSNSLQRGNYWDGGINKLTCRFSFCSAPSSAQSPAGCLSGSGRTRQASAYLHLIVPWSRPRRVELNLSIVSWIHKQNSQIIVDGSMLEELGTAAAESPALEGPELNSLCASTFSDSDIVLTTRSGLLIVVRCSLLPLWVDGPIPRALPPPPVKDERVLLTRLIRRFSGNGTGVPAEPLLLGLSD